MCMCIYLDVLEMLQLKVLQLETGFIYFCCSSSEKPEKHKYLKSILSYLVAVFTCTLNLLFANTKTYMYMYIYIYT